MNKFFIYTFLLAISFSSCRKQIEGRVIDNFGNSLKDVDVTIHRSQYATKSGSNGQFAIDYAAGEIIMEFRNEGYVGMDEILHITEKQTFPLKDVVLTKIPDESGIYIASNELSDYIQLDQQNSISTKLIDEGSNGFFRRKSLEFYSTNTDSTTVIKLSSLDDVRLYHYRIKPQLLGKVGEDKKIGILSVDVFHTSPKANQAVNQAKKAISNNINMYTFNPEFDTDYVYIFENGFKNSQKLQPIHFIFRFEQK